LNVLQVQSLESHFSSEFLLRLPLLSVSFSLALILPAAAAAPAQTQRLITIEDIYAHGNPTSDPPKGLVWAPDGGRITFLSAESDLMELSPVTGKTGTLVNHTKLSVLGSAPADEKDRDHRARYNEASYQWDPDSKHLLFDSSGQLFFYSLDTGTATDIASTGTGSGDDPKFSPNGEFVSYVREHNLYLRRLQEQTAEITLTNTHKETLLNGEVDWVYLEELAVRSNYYWSPDSSKIAYLQMNEANVPEYPITDWIPVHATVDKQRYPQPGDPNPQVHVGVVKAQGGKTTWIKLPIDSGNDYVPRFGWINPGTLWIETLARDHKHRSIYFADAQRGEAKLAYTETDEKFFDESYDVEFISGEFYLTSWRDGHTHIYRYGFDPNHPMGAEGASPGPLAHLVKQVTSGDYEVNSVASILENSQTIYYVSNEGDPLQRQVWSIKTDGSEKRQISTAQGVHQPTFAPRSSTYLDIASDKTTPPRAGVCHGADCKIFWQSKPLAEFQLIPAQQLELTAADNKTRIYADLLLPAGQTSPAGVPLIVNPYGGPGPQTVQNAWGSTQSRLFDQVLLQHGFAVLHVDNRGTGGRGRDFAQAAYRNFGPVQLADQLAALDQVLAKYPQLDKNRLGWWGWSWGGTFTLNALTHSDRFRAGVAVAPVTDWRNYDSIYTERYLGLPAENADVYREQSVVNSAQELKGHLLIAHGTGDDNVHFENSIQFIQKLIDADLPYDFQVYPRKTHSISGAEARTQLFQRILAHFEMYLKNPQGGI
jgi:dipeptidyl-peptidase-4